jgi:hypothetical protein
MSTIIVELECVILLSLSERLTVTVYSPWVSFEVQVSDVAGNKAERLITVSVKETNLSTSVIWGGIGNDDKINANEIATVTLNGTVAIIDAVTSINISAIVFKQGNTVAHIINSNLPKINVNDSTWPLENNVVSFTDTVISRSALLPATSVATIVTVSLLCADVCFSA